MATEIIFVYKDDPAAAERIIGAFAVETGLTAEPHEGSVAFAVRGAEHEIKVVETLNGIDANWSRYVSLGDPSSDGAASSA
jgi:hypothetical protein